MRITLIAAALFALLAPARAADEKPTFKVYSLALLKKLPENQRDLSFDFREGTSIGVIVTLAGKRVVDIDVEGSKLESFTDDKGTVLFDQAAKPKPGEFLTNWIEGFPRTSKDGQSVGLTLRAPKTPADGATKINVKGMVALKVGADAKTDEHKDQVFKPGDKIKFGDITLEIPKDQFGGGTSIVFKCEQPSLGPVQFFDAEGKEIKFFPGGTSRVGFGKQIEYHNYISFEKKVEKATIKLTHYKKIDPVQIPLDIQVGLGLQ